MESVVLVDQDDNVIGSMEKMEAHRRGLIAPRVFDSVVQQQGRVATSETIGIQVS